MRVRATSKEVKKTRDDIVKSKNMVRTDPIAMKKTRDDIVKAMSVHTTPKEVKKVEEPDVFDKTVVTFAKKQTPFGKP